MRLRRLLLRSVIAYLALTLALAVGLGELPFHVGRIPLQDGPSARAMAARFGAGLEDVNILAQDGTRLSAWFAHPARANGNAVILLHGVGDNRQGMLGFAELFLSRGYAVLLPDSRAQSASGGGFPTYGIREVHDVRKWYEWLQHREGLTCLFGFGESMGAAIVLQSLRTTPFCAVIAESPFADFRQIAYIRVGQLFRTGPWLGRYALRPAVELAFVYALLTRGGWLPNASPESSVATSTVPVLLIHGLADDNIPAQQSAAIRAHNRQVNLWLVPHAGHCGAVSVEPEEFNRRVLAWFRDHSKQRPGLAGTKQVTGMASNSVTP